MRKSWRTYVLLLLVGVWPHLGCVQPPGDKSLIQPKAGATTSLKQDLSASDILMAQAELLQSQKKPLEAMALYEKMREPGNPNTMVATKKIAMIHESQGDLGRAEDEYKLVVQRNPKDADALTRIGDMYLHRKQWAAAEKWYRDALFAQTTHVPARTGLGFALAHKGDYENSLKQFTQVVSEAEAYCEIAFVMKLEGKHQEAMRAYQAALDRDRTLQRARVELTRMQQAMLTDPFGPAVPMQRTGRQGVAQLEETPLLTLEGMGRLMRDRVTLPPIPDVVP